VFEALEIPYFIGGSLATAVHGVARATMDVDLIADMLLEHVEPFIHALGETFFADDEMIKTAILQRSSFNIIHKETMFKVDVFVGKKRPFDRSQFTRRATYSLATNPERTAYFASPEDNILTKLEWYQHGGGVSDRQWHDILSVIQIQGDRLDRPYLDHWAARLGVDALLERAFTELQG
jgi:hypothetical protein